MTEKFVVKTTKFILRPEYFSHLQFVDRALEGTFWRSLKSDRDSPCAGYSPRECDIVITRNIPSRWV